ncbi:MAG: biotin--[acetyl-CoA-carboxylase] ligase [Bacteriovorax sp.]|nr:biotin--[acetyl-CoA-carboxylase] ligase [Bacteriovorax sp.]
MNHQHFNSIPSTQIYLKDNLDTLKSSDPDVLISCSEQTHGIGRRGNNWDTYPNSLALSFTLRPNDIATLTPLEIGLIVINFFKIKFNKDLFLKWPNDILTSDGKKCGGILCQYVDQDTIVVGLGINLGKLEDSINNNYRHGLGSVDQNLELQVFDQVRISSELYSDLLYKRFSSAQELKDSFNKHCFHMNMDVFIYEDEKDHIGIFRGIGDNGEALVEIDCTIHSFLSSSLTILN